MQQSAHILIVEDDADIRRMIAELLRHNGYRVQTAREGGELDHILEVSRIDLLILDIGLPQEDGLSLCKRIRTQSSVPIIILTARGSELERVTGLESGADDYLTKPFGTHELLARIRALLRRARSVPHLRPEKRHSGLHFAGWRLDIDARRLRSSDGTAVALTGGEFELLMAFCEHPKRVLSRDQLADLTRGKAAAPCERSIDLQVSRLRRKIEQDPKDPLLVQTVRAEGYIFTPEVSAT
jgi:two-component system OmpR family response regulator